MDYKQIKHSLPPTCRLIAVSKKQTVEKIEALYQMGQMDFAENYSQELIEKQYHFRDYPGIKWHFIGAIQKNKLKHIVGNVSLIHSVGNLEAAEAINQFAEKKGIIQDLLLQLNLAHESTKSGWTEQKLFDSVENLKELQNIKICGLMTLPPLFDNPEDLRPYFKKLKEIAVELQKYQLDCKELSMGTSHDYQVAIPEGATMVRLGTLIFGKRET